MCVAIQANLFGVASLKIVEKLLRKIKSSGYVGDTTCRV